MDFHLFRVFLSPKQRSDLFDSEPVQKDQPGAREEWLRQVFSEELRFVHRRRQFVFIPIAAEVGTLVAGKVGRQRTIKENTPPEQGFQETAREQWRAALFLMDPSSHEDGQKIALEHHGAVGEPDAVIATLFKSINGRQPPEPYRAAVNSIADPASFWQFVNENERAITSVTFRVVMPNMFGGRDDFQAEMRELRDKHRAQKAELKLQSQDGLELATEKVREAVDYTTRGGGSVRARAGRRKYDSSNKGKRVTISPPDPPALDSQKREEGILRSVFDTIFLKDGNDS